jgi:hypothetical protein
VRVIPAGRGATVKVEGNWRGQPPKIEVALPGFRAMTSSADVAREEFNVVAAS